MKSETKAALLGWRLAAQQTGYKPVKGFRVGPYFLEPFGSKDGKLCVLMTHDAGYIVLYPCIVDGEKVRPYRNEDELPDALPRAVIV